MGCTSSAPNMADIQTNTTDEADDNKNLETRDEKVNENQKNVNTDNVLNNIKVLPICDNLDDNIQLARNNSSINISNQQVENDDQQNNKLTHENMVSVNEATEIDTKMSTLKDVVEQVILDNILEDKQNVLSAPADMISLDDSKETVAEEVTEPQEHQYVEELKEIEQEEENIDEVVSPSLSECSRSTRWEALADIAAELPASLAVDPLTGQIYSLTK
ncbi:unnamed protein product, partial [Brenthis ino]